MNLLKRSTEEQHAALERSLGLPGSTLTLELYTRLLERMYGYYVPWETLACPLVDRIIPGFSEARRKIPWLEQDLGLLPSSPLASLPICDAMPDLDTPAAALGSMYVIEGSTLGGRILSRCFAGQPGVRADSGGRFFAGYGDATGAMWKQFGEAVGDHVCNDRMAAEAVRAAQATFETMHNWLVRP